LTPRHAVGPVGFLGILSSRMSDDAALCAAAYAQSGPAACNGRLRPWGKTPRLVARCRRRAVTPLLRLTASVPHLQAAAYNIATTPRRSAAADRPDVAVAISPCAWTEPCRRCRCSFVGAVCNRRLEDVVVISNNR
jgi:hypothetical protein